MSGFSWGWLTGKQSSDCEIPEIFPLGVLNRDFVHSDIVNTYVKILTDVAERTHGLDKEQEPLLWDSCEQSDSNHGLISLLAHAMTNKADLFVVYKASVKVLRKATTDEERQIREDYKAKGESAVGVFVSFKNYRRTEILSIYSSFEYCVLSSLNKTLNVSKSIQFKINDLRSSVAMADAAIATAQARSIAQAMKNGNDVLLDSKDSVATTTPDTAPAEKAITFLDGKRAFILGLPLSYINGEQTGGLNASGEGDLRAIERGLRQYFVSIIRPVFNSVFGKDVEFKSQDFREMTTGLEVLKSFELTSNDYISNATKQSIVARVFNLDEDEEKKQIEKEAKEDEAKAALAAKNRPPAPALVPPGNGVIPPANPAGNKTNPGATA